MRIGCDRCLSATPLIFFVNPPRIPPQPLLWGLPDPPLKLLDYCCCDVEYILLLVSGTRHIHFLHSYAKSASFCNALTSDEPEPRAGMAGDHRRNMGKPCLMVEKGDRQPAAIHFIADEGQPTAASDIVDHSACRRLPGVVFMAALAFSEQAARVKELPLPAQKPIDTKVFDGAVNPGRIAAGHGAGPDSKLPVSHVQRHADMRTGLAHLHGEGVEPDDLETIRLRSDTVEKQRLGRGTSHVGPHFACDALAVVPRCVGQSARHVVEGALVSSVPRPNYPPDSNRRSGGPAERQKPSDVTQHAERAILGRVAYPTHTTHRARRS